MSNLTKQIDSLLELDAKGALSPHGIGGLARELLEKCKAELNTRAVPDVPELVTVGHLWEYAEYHSDDSGYYGYVKIITEENPNTHVSPASKIRHHRELVTRDQAAEIIQSMIPRVNNCGRYIAERNDGTLMYLNHGNTWQGCDNFIAAKDKEIEKLICALSACQKALDSLVSEESIKNTTVVNAYAMCIDAELKARKALKGEINV